MIRLGKVCSLPLSFGTIAKQCTFIIQQRTVSSGLIVGVASPLRPRRRRKQRSTSLDEDAQPLKKYHSFMLPLLSSQHYDNFCMYDISHDIVSYR